MYHHTQNIEYQEKNIMAQSTNNNGATIGIILVVVLAVVAAVYFMDAGNRNGDTKIGNAVEEFTDNAERGRVGEGIEEAGEELQERSTGEKIGDAIEDTGRDIQDAANDASE
jgi:hypothetical protein